MAEFNNATLQGVGIFFIILVNFVCVVRIWARFGQSFRWDDAWLSLAYCFYMATSIAFLVKGEQLFRYTKFLQGGPDYPGRVQDNISGKSLFFFSPMGFWLTLWCVKASLLALYKKMMIQLPIYVQLWWGVVVFCVLVIKQFRWFDPEWIES